MIETFPDIAVARRPKRVPQNPASLKLKSKADVPDALRSMFGAVTDWADFENNYQVIEEGLDGRTTDARDPGSPISG